MPNQTLQSFAKINPLIGLPPKTLRLYNALAIVKKESADTTEAGWFPVSDSDRRLTNIGFSQQSLKRSLQELVQVDLLQIREEQGIRWYNLK